KLSERLRYGSNRGGDSEVVTDPIPVLAPGQSTELDPLVADAMGEGPATCTVTARSPGGIAREKGDEARSVGTGPRVEPKLAGAVRGPQRRCTATSATYEVVVRNPGTAPARKVRVIAQVPPGLRPTRVDDRARYDQTTQRLQWTIDTLEPGSAPWKT